MLDRLYYFDKDTHIRQYYGEITSEHNFNFVIDGTKDTTQVQVYNYTREELKPYTIVYLEITQTWWVVSSDMSKRFADESDGFYEHTIKLVGAKELLNARDLTNCGFNIDRYTIRQFLDRLVAMSDFEFPITWNLSPYIDESQVVNYLKTFSNYTPMTALREFFDGMNCEYKLTFNTSTSGENIVISGATISAISKSGITDTPIDISYFDNEEETLTSDKSSFGTKVVSNVENCISGDTIRYPSRGSVKLSSNDYTTNGNNAVLRLPSNVYQAKSITIYSPVFVDIISSSTSSNKLEISGSQSDIRTQIDNYIDNRGYSEPHLTDSEFDLIISWINRNCIAKLNSGTQYNQVSGTGVWTGDYMRTYGIVGGQPSQTHIRTYGFNSKQYFDTCLTNYQDTNKAMIYWEQGKDTIENFCFLNHYGIYNPTGLEPIVSSDTELHIRYYLVVFRNAWSALNTTFAVEYIPMSDIKVKVDNDKNSNDTALFNQNGKLVDSKSVSKLINAHAIEISSNELTLSKVYHTYSNILKVGQVVYSGNDKYIINNVSIDITGSELSNMFAFCLYTMTKATACKSAMINANTIIRDYECPQQNNVIRPQLYRDYIEFGYTQESTETPYMPLSRILNFSDYNYGMYDNHFALIKCSATEFVSENNPYGYYTYQLPSIKYNLNKQYVEVVDFKDNNIIGYEANINARVFRIVDMLSWKDYADNVPISYVDKKGELNGIDIYFLTDNQMYNAYYTTTGVGNNAGGVIGRYVSVAREVFENAISSTNNYDFKIQESNYKKDGLEVPMFEYCCQVGDSNEIVFGDNFLKSQNLKEVVQDLVETTKTKTISYPVGSEISFSANETKTISFSFETGLIYVSGTAICVPTPLETPSPFSNTINSYDGETGVFSLNITNTANTSKTLKAITMNIVVKEYQDMKMHYYYSVQDNANVSQENSTLYMGGSLESVLTYDDSTKKISVKLKNRVLSLKNKSVVVYYAKDIGNGQTEKCFMFAINNCRVNGTQGGTVGNYYRTIDLFVNCWKLK